MNTRLSDLDTDHYVTLFDPEEIVQSNWCYLYDLWDCPEDDPDMVVRPDWIGKKAKDCTMGWQFFLKPKNTQST